MTSKLDLEDWAKRQEAEKKRDKGAQDAKTLKAMLVRKYGTSTAAWKHGLDIHGNGRLPFGDFCNAMRRLGFTGHMRKAFEGMDKDKKGAVTLKDLDVEAHDVLTEF